MNRTRALRIAAALFGAGLLASAGTAVASAAEHGEDDIDVTVDIAQIDEPGVLAMTVAGTSTALVETGSTDLIRQFTGTLPTVTVTDTRAPSEIAAGAAWYVLGSATDFAGSADQPDISAANLGWQPQLVGDDSDGLVFAGEPVEGAVDGGAGLSDTELFASTFDSAGAAEVGNSWTATAQLVLRTPADVAAGSYSSTVTLSLFE